MLLELLNSAYEGWGDEEIFRWKYDDYPDFKKEYGFYIEDGHGNPICFGRVARRELIFTQPQKKIKGFTLGDAAVDPSHQGEGLYSYIHKARTDFVESQDADAILAFVRKTNVSYKVNKKRGWGHRNLPLKMLILSPGKFVKNYADLALADIDIISSFIGFFGKWIDLTFSDEKITLSELIEGKTSDTKSKLKFSISDFAVKRFIEEIDEEIELLQLINLFSKLLMSGDIVLGNTSPKKFEHDRREYKNLLLEHRDELTQKEIDEILFLYSKKLKDFDLYFRRDEQDIEHLLSHPNLADILVIKKDSNIVGFCVLINQNKKSGSDEIWVYECIWDNDEAKHLLLNEIEQVGFRRNLDAVLMISDLILDNKWTDISYQTITWDLVEDKPEIDNILRKGDWRITLYDIL